MSWPLRQGYWVRQHKPSRRGQGRHSQGKPTPCPHVPSASFCFTPNEGAAFQEYSKNIPLTTCTYSSPQEELWLPHCRVLGKSTGCVHLTTLGFLWIHSLPQLLLWDITKLGPTLGLSELRGGRETKTMLLSDHGHQNTHFPLFFFFSFPPLYSWQWNTSFGMDILLLRIRLSLSQPFLKLG